MILRVVKYIKLKIFLHIIIFVKKLNILENYLKECNLLKVII